MKWTSGTRVYTGLPSQTRIVSALNQSSEVPSALKRPQVWIAPIGRGPPAAPPPRGGGAARRGGRGGAALGPVLNADVDDLVCDLGERLVPRDALPLAGSSFANAPQRVLDARGVVHQVAVADALLAAARVEVGYRLVGLGVHGVLLLPPDE